MKYRQLSDTGVFVSEICLGTMTFGGQAGIWRTIGGLEQKAVDAIVQRALDAGVNFLDTANVYSGGESETLLATPRGPASRPVAATEVRIAEWDGARARWGCRGSTSWRRSTPPSRLRATTSPLSDSPVRCLDEHRGHASDARRCGSCREGALHRLLEPRRLANHEGAGRVA